MVAASMDSIWIFRCDDLRNGFSNMVGLFFLFLIVKKELARYFTSLRESVMFNQKYIKRLIILFIFRPKHVEV